MVRQSIRSLLIEYPKLKTPLLAGIIIWTAMLVGAGVTVFVIGYEDHQRTNTVARVSRVLTEDHNISACTFRVLLVGLRYRAQKTEDDPTTLPAAKDRARTGVKFYSGVIDGQITEPKNLDCRALLRRVARERKVPSVRTTG